MAKKISVSKLTVNEHDANVFVKDQQLLMNKQIVPEGRMLADTDNLSFIYILDVEDDYIYLEFGKEVWDFLNKVLLNNLPLVLHLDHGQKISLTHLNEELHYLISNIDKNNNYGKEMVKAVGEFFSNQR